MNKQFYIRPKTGTGKTAMRVNSDFNEQNERVRQRVQRHIAAKELPERAVTHRKD